MKLYTNIFDKYIEELYNFALTKLADPKVIIFYLLCTSNVFSPDKHIYLLLLIMCVYVCLFKFRLITQWIIFGVYLINMEYYSLLVTLCLMYLILGLNAMNTGIVFTYTLDVTIMVINSYFKLNESLIYILYGLYIIKTLIVVNIHLNKIFIYIIYHFDLLPHIQTLEIPDFVSTYFGLPYSNISYYVDNIKGIAEVVNCNMLLVGQKTTFQVFKKRLAIQSVDNDTDVVDYEIRFIALFDVYKISKSNNINRCPICYKSNPQICILKIACKHEFCVKCAMRWFQHNKLCPICRAKITYITIHYQH